jgi:hypothetical protein
LEESFLTTHFPFASLCRPYAATRNSVSHLYAVPVIHLTRRLSSGDTLKEIKMTNEPQNQNSAPAIVPAVAAAPATANQGKSDMLNVEIKKVWSKLSDEDLKLQDKPEQFLARIKEKQGISTEDAQKRLTEIKASCGSCMAEKAA